MMGACGREFHNWMMTVHNSMEERLRRDDELERKGMD